MPAAPKRILIICRSAPYSSARAREALDVALVGATYDQTIHLLYMADGVLQLLTNQQAAAISQKNTGAMLSALELYGIDRVYVQASALQQRGLGAAELILAADVLDDSAIARLIRQHDCVLSF